MLKSIEKIHPFLKEQRILFPVLILSGIGIVMVYSASFAISMESHNTMFYYAKKQAVFFVIGLFIMFLTSSFPYKLYESFAYLILLVSIGLLIAVLIPSLNVEAGGANRWLKFFAFTFQPAEFAKLSLILFLGHSLSKKQSSIKKFSIGFIPHALIIVLFACLILVQPDFGTVIVLGMIASGMMFAARVRLTHLLISIPFLVTAFYLFVFSVDYRWKRIVTFRNPWADPYDAGYQITHSLKAFGSGGIWGKGMGLSMQKLHFLPEAHTDFIFSIIGEEFGLVGVLVILSVYLFLLIKGFKIAKTSKDILPQALLFILVLRSSSTQELPWHFCLLKG